MSSFLFYDPNNRHPELQLHLDIAYIEDMNTLRNSIINNNNLRQHVCICSGNKSELIDGIKNEQHIVSIYLCKSNSHGEPETNPVHSSKVKDILFTPSSGWKFKGRLALLEECIKCQHNAHAQGLNELQRLKEIEQQSLSTPQQSTETTEH